VYALRESWTKQGTHGVKYDSLGTSAVRAPDVVRRASRGRLGTEGEVLSREVTHVYIIYLQNCSGSNTAVFLGNTRR
jgi:hypothetical protein